MDPGLYFLNLAHVCLVVSGILLLIQKKNLSNAYRYLGFYLIWNLVIEFFAWVFQVRGVNNLPLLHVYTLGEFILFSLFYRTVFSNSCLFTQNFSIFLIVISGLIISNSLFVQSIFGFNSYAKTLVQLILIGYALYSFFESGLSQTKQEKDLMWVHSAVLIYYSGSLFIFLFSDYFLRFGEGMPKEFWMVNAFLNLIFHVLVLSSICKLWVRRRFSY